jgi:hypothetical protein
MTEREQQYVNDCHRLLAAINLIPLEPGAKAVCVNALSKHIREVMGMWAEPSLSTPDGMCFLVGLTFADIIQMQNLGSIEVNPKDVGLIDMPITIFLGGTEEHMKKGLDKHPGTAHKFLDTHGDTKN